MSESGSGLKTFGARCVFQHHESLFEERIVVLRAPDADSAIEVAEREATQYAAATGVKALEFVQVYEMFDKLEEGAEVFSLLRSSTLSADAYLDRYFDNGEEHEEKG